MYGNIRWQSTGPIYLDSPLTPDYVALPDDGSTIYRGWQASTCSLVGEDNRIRDHAQPGAALDNAQTFYTTWDANGLRLSWTGANWDTDGDLFVYLDTRSGGTSRVYDPYHTTMSNTAILLPTTQANTQSTQRRLDARRASVQRRALDSALTSQISAEIQAFDTLSASLDQATASGQMAADYAVWVQDSTHATLLAWNPVAQAWQTVTTDWTFVADTNAALPQTDVYLPFTTLGIGDAPSASLSLVAFASENNALQLWAHPARPQQRDQSTRAGCGDSVRPDRISVSAGLSLAVAGQRCLPRMVLPPRRKSLRRSPARRNRPWRTRWPMCALNSAPSRWALRTAS